MTVGPIWNTGGTETEIIVPVSVLGPERAGTEMGGDRDDCSVSQFLEHHKKDGSAHKRDLITRKMLFLLFAQRFQLFNIPAL